MSEETTPQTHGPQFGAFDWVDADPGRSAAEVYDGRLRLLAEADRGGFRTYHVAEHHGTPLGLAPSPGLFVAAASRVSARIRIAPTTFVVPLYHPLRLAEEIAMLDQLTGGRLEVGVGRGSSPYEAAGYGLDAEQAAQRFQQDLPVILDALGTGRFRRPDVDDDETIELHVACRQRPHPPLWYPTSNAASIPRLGGQGYNVLFGFAFASGPLADIRAQSRIFFERFRAARDAGAQLYPLTDDTPLFGVMRHVVVADTDDEAQRLARAAFVDHQANFSYLWRQHHSERFTQELDVDELLANDKLFVGSPQTVAAQVARVVAEAEINYFAGAFAWGSLPVDAALHSLRLFRDEVIPATRSLDAMQPSATGGKPE